MKKDPKGRERTAYFLWTGRESSVNEKGASALMATEIDKEVGTQVMSMLLKTLDIISLPLKNHSCVELSP